MRKISAPLIFCVLSGLLTPYGHAQREPPSVAAPAFEVVSIKPAGPRTALPPNTWDFMGCRNSPGRMNCKLSLLNIITMAYSLDDWQLAGPGWLAIETYEITAKLPAETASSQRRLMLRAMLVERFGLKFHYNQKEIPVYALVAGSNGPKLQPAPDPGAHDFRSGPGRFTSAAISMKLFAANLKGAAGRPVIDATGLDGAYRIDLEWTPDYEENAGNGRRDRGILGILEDQLGLKLEARKIQVDIMVIDHADKIPTPN